ncbi:MAG: DUF1385 domain-containing protein [Peptococcaceae bacterium]|nr:DUF1385 domain-containing protein [Peptococcaceae bacterium]
MKNSFDYGGQAVIEGVMMRGPLRWSVAVRKPDRTIEVETREVETITRRFPFLKWPFIRGTVVLFESLIVGIEALSFSASLATGEEEKPITKWEMALTILAAFGLAILLFVLLPVAVAHLTLPYVQGNLAQNLIEGILRVVVFLLYVVAVGRMKDIRRVFQYHGAEHKVINAYEAGAPMTIADIQRFKTLHPRCGTSFLMIVLVISILVFSVLATEPLWWRFVSRLLMLPVVAGLGYEFIKFTGKHSSSAICRVLMAPGLWLQKLTTRPPDDDQVEVALMAFNAVAKEGETNA